LGNLLMPWARCMIAAHTEGLPVLAPTWPQLKVGPLLRGEADLRSYAGVFLSQGDEIDGPRRIFALAAGSRFSESGDTLRQGLSSLRLRVFSGMGGMFGPLRGHSQLIGSELMARVRPEHIPDLSSPTPLGIHVRCADFRVTTSVGPGGVRSGERVPIRYYVHALEALRAAFDGPVPATVYSDGTNEEIAPLLALDHVHRAPSKSAMFDMLAMSRHRVLLGSPHSTFSMWAAFLGESYYVTFSEADRDYGIANVALQPDIETWGAQLARASVGKRLLG
jgi:hypothetical protein